MGNKDLGIYLNIGKKIKDIRKQRGFTQKDFAQLLIIPVTTYENYENGNRTPKTDMIEKIASALEIDVTELLETKPQKVHTIFDKMDWFRDLGYQIGFDADSKLYYISRNDEKYYSITREEVESIRQLTRNTIETLCFDEKHQVSPEKVNGRLRDKNA